MIKTLKFVSKDLYFYISLFFATHNLYTIGPFIDILVLEDSKCSNVLQQLLCFLIVVNSMDSSCPDEWSKDQVCSILIRMNDLRLFFGFFAPGKQLLSLPWSFIKICCLVVGVFAPGKQLLSSPWSFTNICCLVGEVFAPGKQLLSPPWSFTNICCLVVEFFGNGY